MAKAKAKAKEEGEEVSDEVERGGGRDPASTPDHSGLRKYPRSFSAS